MKTSVVGLIACCVLALGLFYSDAAAWADDKKSTCDGWLLERLNGLGEERLYVSANGVKIDYPGANYTVVSLPPKWDITWYSKSSRTCYSQPLADYRASKGMPRQCRRMRLVGAKRAKYAGIKALEFTRSLSGSESDSQPLFPRVTGSHALRLVGEEYFFSEPIDLPEGALMFLSSFFGTPNYGCIPLAGQEKMSDGSIRKIWFTKKITKAPIAKTEFILPRGYKTVVSRFKVTSGGGYTEGLDDLAKDMKVGEGFGKH